LGTIFASCSLDGNIKIYDGVNSNCINSFVKAHGGFAVTCIEFSKCGKYLLSSGLDSVGRLWDLGSSSVLVEFKGAAMKRLTAKLSFTYNEEHVVGICDDTMSFVVWNSKGKIVQKVQGKWYLILQPTRRE
jgi:cleavage stimulation factor subunit 1